MSAWRLSVRRRSAGLATGFVLVPVLLAGLGPASRAVAAAPPEPPAVPTPAPTTDLEALAYEIQSLRAGLGELRDAAQRLDVPPPWAARAQDEVLKRIEHVQAMQERLAARLETPVPRLDEPIVLLTVAGATLILGFFIGRTVQRRSSRRDRFRL